MLDLMRLFVQVVEHKSYTQVARNLGVSQPAVSNQIRVFEEKLGVKLFNKSGKSFTLTPQGEAVLKSSLRILDEWNSLLQEFDDDLEEIIGKVHIGASHIPGEYLLTEYLRSIQQIHPRIAFKITIGDSLEMAEKLLSQEVDFAVVGANFNTEKLDSKYWLQDTIQCVVSENHPLARAGSIQLEDLMPYPMVIREAGSGHRRAIEDAFGALGYNLDNFNIGFEAGSAETVKNAVRSGLGYTFLSVHALNSARDGLVAREVKGLNIERGFYLLTRRQKSLSKAARFCYDYLAQQQK